MRDYKTQEALFELLTKQDELAKINEARDTSTLQVLDDAVVPDKKSRPRRSLIVLLATFVAGFLAVLAAFLKEYFARMPVEDRGRWEEVKGALKWKRPGREK